jgi:hypothetical protein
VIGTLPASKKNELFTEIEGYYPAIVDGELFENVQSLLSLNTGRKATSPYPHSINIFKDILICPCGGRIAVSGSSPKQMGSYKCFHSQTSNGCSAKSISRRKFEKAMMERLFPMLEAIDLDPSPKISTDIKDAEKRKADVDSRISNLVKLAELGIEDVESRLIELNDQKKKITGELSVLLSQQTKPFNGLIIDDLESIAGRQNAQLSISNTIQRLVLDTVNKTVDITLRNGNIWEGYSLEPHPVYPEETEMYDKNRFAQMADDELGMITGIKGQMRYKS